MNKSFTKLLFLIVFSFFIIIEFEGCKKMDWPTDPPDSERPEVTAVTPESESIMVPPDAKIQLEFNINMDISSLNENAKVYKDNDTNAIAGQWEGGNGTYTFTPANTFEELSKYSVKLQGAFNEGDQWKGPGLRSADGISMKYENTFFFSTKGNYGTSPLYLGSGNPGNAAEGKTGIGIVKDFETTEVGNFSPDGSLSIELNPLGTELYIASLADNAVGVLETSTGSISATIPMPDSVEEPWFIAFTPDGSEAWVLCRGTNDVVVINTATRSIITTIPLADYCQEGAFLYKLAIDHAGKKGYISTRTGQSVIVVDIVNKSAITNIENVVEEEATGEIVILPDDSKVLVCNNWASPSFRIIDPATNTVEGELELGEGGDYYFTEVVDNYLYMAGRWNALIYKIDLTDFSVAAEINIADEGIIDEMQGITVDPAKQVVYVVANTYEDGAVLIFRASDLSFLGAIKTGPWRDIVVKK